MLNGCLVNDIVYSRHLGGDELGILRVHKVGHPAAQMRDSLLDRNVEREASGSGVFGKRLAHGMNRANGTYCACP